MMAASDNNSRESSPLMRLIVSSNQTGCLLGKGGSVIAEMRKLSGAHIRILGKEQVPKSVSDNEEVVQVGMHNLRISSLRFGKFENLCLLFSLQCK